MSEAKTYRLTKLDCVLLKIPRSHMNTPKVKCNHRASIIYISPFLSAISHAKKIGTGMSGLKNV